MALTMTKLPTHPKINKNKSQIMIFLKLELSFESFGTKM
jgi:hypothetical protein